VASVKPVVGVDAASPAVPDRDGGVARARSVVVRMESASVPAFQVLCEEGFVVI
jgi:hypothetical protein